MSVANSTVQLLRRSGGLPKRVELLDGKLTIRSSLPYWSHGKPGRVIRPKSNLLDSFISPASGSSQITSSTSLDERICAFANRYGGLQMFCEYRKGSDGPLSSTLSIAMFGDTSLRPWDP